MGAANTICLVIYLIAALVMIGIGVSQQRSRTPAGFYSGEKPFDEKEISDVALWNKKHGTMWIVYGMVIILSYVVGAVMGADSAWSNVPLIGGIIVPLIVMIWYHHRLIELYIK